MLVRAGCLCIAFILKRERQHVRTMSDFFTSGGEQARALFSDTTPFNRRVLLTEVAGLSDLNTQLNVQLQALSTGIKVGSKCRMKDACSRCCVLRSHAFFLVFASMLS